MSRWFWFFAAGLAGLLLVVCGLLIPLHIRAVDASVLHAAGRGTPTLSARAMELLQERKLGAAQLLLQVAQAEGLAERRTATEAAGKLASEQPRLQFWGGPEPALRSITDQRRANSGGEPFTEFVVRREHRERALDFLRNSNDRAVQELLFCRQLTNTVIFPPSWTSSGQAMDAAISVTGLLLAEGRLPAGLSNEVVTLAFNANRGASSHRLEQALLDMMSLGQRLNWGQLVVLVEHMQSVETLRLFASTVRKDESELPSLYSAVVLAGDAKLVTRYVVNFGRTGTQDIRAGLHYGEGGLRVLLERNKRLRHSPFDALLISYIPFDSLPKLALRMPGLALALKWLLYALGGYLLASAVHYYLLARAAAKYDIFSPTRSAGTASRPLDLPPVKGFHIARQILFALGFLLVVLLVSEPFLAQESQKVDMQFRLRLPSAGIATSVGSTVTAVKTSLMNTLSLMTLLLVFVLQALIYAACVFKLAEIRRQKVGPRMKLKLLENEEHLFDAGLYLGFVGTIISLILVSIGIVKLSLMAAYSSTSLGIIFVSLFKIFNLRPVRRRLLLEGESAPAEPTVVQPATSTP